MNIIVYILTNDSKSTRVQRASSLFENQMFTVNICDIKPPKDTTVSPQMSVADAIEFYRFTWCLDNVKQKHPNNYVIIAQDTCVSSADTDTIADAITQTIKKKKWDILYLCRWLDRCKDNSDIERLDGYSGYIVKTMSPHGLQALMFSPSGRDKILGYKRMNNGKLFGKRKVHPLDIMLNDHIGEDNLSAYALGNNLIEYDLSHARTTRDYLRLAQCEVDSKVHKEENITNFSIWWFVLIVVAVAIIILIFANVNLGKKAENDKLINKN